MQPEGRASNTALHILYAWGVLPQIINKNLRRKKRITETLQISFQKKIGQKGQTGSTVTKNTSTASTTFTTFIAYTA